MTTKPTIAANCIDGRPKPARAKCARRRRECHARDGRSDEAGLSFAYQHGGAASFRTLRFALHRNVFFVPGVRMRLAACFLAILLIAACGSDGGPLPVPTDRVRARFPPGGVVDAIEIDAVDRLPLRTAELVAPDGGVTPASWLTVNPSPSVTFYQRFPNSPYAGNTFGVGNIPSAEPLPGDLGGAPQGAARLLAMVSAASIPLPDPVAYRRDWRSYRIFLSFGDLSGEVERRVLAAPEAPPGG
jgi:hypothetical protein